MIFTKYNYSIVIIRSALNSIEGQHSFATVQYGLNLTSASLAQNSNISKPIRPPQNKLREAIKGDNKCIIRE